MVRALGEELREPPPTEAQPATNRGLLHPTPIDDGGAIIITDAPAARRPRPAAAETPFPDDSDSDLQGTQTSREHHLHNDGYQTGSSQEGVPPADRGATPLADAVFPAVLPFQPSSSNHIIDPAFTGDFQPTPIADTPPRRRILPGDFHELTPTQDMARAQREAICQTPATGGWSEPDAHYIGSPGRRSESLPPRSPDEAPERMRIDSHQRAAKRSSSATGRRVRFATTPTDVDDPRPVPLRNGQDSDSSTLPSTTF